MRSRTTLAFCVAATAALCAIAALAPTLATAVINNAGTTGCGAPSPGDQIYWNGDKWCVVQEGTGGTAGAGTGTGAGGPLIFWAQSDAPKDLPSDCLHKNAGACMPTQRGGREVQEAKDGPIGWQKGGESKAGKSETAKGKKAEKTKGVRQLAVKKCLELEKKEVGVWKPPADLAEVRGQQSDHINLLQRWTTQLNAGRADGSIDGDEQAILEGRIRFERLKIDELQYRLDAKKRWDAKLEAWKKKCAPVLDVK